MPLRTLTNYECLHLSRSINSLHIKKSPVQTVHTLEVLPFCQIPGYSRAIPGQLIPVTGTSNSYSPSIWGPGTQVLGLNGYPSTRVPRYSLVYFENLGDGKLSPPTSRPMGNVSYITSRKPFSKGKSFIMPHISHHTTVEVILLYRCSLLPIPGYSPVLYLSCYYPSRARVTLYTRRVVSLGYPGTRPK